MDARVAKALEHVPHLIDHEAFKTKLIEDVDGRFKTVMKDIEAEMEELRSNLGANEVSQSSRFCDVEDTVEELNTNIQQIYEKSLVVDAQFAELGARLMPFEADVKRKL